MLNIGLTASATFGYGKLNDHSRIDYRFSLVTFVCVHAEIQYYRYTEGKVEMNVCIYHMYVHT